MLYNKQNFIEFYLTHGKYININCPNLKFQDNSFLGYRVIGIFTVNLILPNCFLIGTIFGKVIF